MQPLCEESTWASRIGDRRVDLYVRAEHEMEDEQAEEPGWFRKALHSGGSAFLIAFICNKATFPIRAPITVGLTPVVARRVLHSSPSRIWSCKADQRLCTALRFIDCQMCGVIIAHGQASLQPPSN